MLRELFGLPSRRELVEWIQPQKTFDDVILPESTRQQLQNALVQIEKHNLIMLFEKRVQR